MKIERRLSFALLAALAFFCLALLIKNGEIAANGIKKGVALCRDVLLPSLFPFLVLSEILLLLGATAFPAKILARPLSRLLGIGEDGCSVLLLGVLCGVPVATAAALSLEEKGQLSRAEFCRLNLFANTPSAGFVILVVGGALFGSPAAGAALFLALLLSALTVGFLLHVFGKKLPREEKKQGDGIEKPISVPALTACVQKGFSTFLQISAFVLLFSLVTEAINAATGALPPLPRVLLGGIAEMTGGVANAVATLPPRTAFLVSAFLLGFSGISVALQIFSVAERLHPRLSPFLLSKIAQGLLSLFFAAIYLKIANPALSPATPTFLELARKGTRLSFYLLYVTLLFLFCFLSLLFKKKIAAAKGGNRKKHRI